MYWEINVSKNGNHLFATAKRSITSVPELDRVFGEIRQAFKGEEYKISVSKYEEKGNDVTFNQNQRQNRLDILKTWPGDIWVNDFREGWVKTKYVANHGAWVEFEFEIENGNQRSVKCYDLMTHISFDNPEAPFESK